MRICIAAVTMETCPFCTCTCTCTDNHVALLLSIKWVDQGVVYLFDYPVYLFSYPACLWNQGVPIIEVKYCIYLIKHPGVYFHIVLGLAEGAFKRDGRLFETGVYCFVYFKLLLISSYYALFGCCHSSQLKS